MHPPLAAIGELAANIAHEINNPLTTVLGFASFIAERLPVGDPTREELGLIQEEASRARDIVRDLLQFSRQRDFTPEPSDVNTVLEQVVAMVAARAPERGDGASARAVCRGRMTCRASSRCPELLTTRLLDDTGLAHHPRTVRRDRADRVSGHGPGIPVEILSPHLRSFLHDQSGVIGTGLGLS